MGVGVVGEHHARVEHVARVAEPLDLPHHRVELVAVLAAHERRHHPAGAVLGLERAVLAEHQLHHVLGEPEKRSSEPPDEPLGEHEVDVAVLGVPEDHAVGVAVPVEQRGEPLAGAAAARAPARRCPPATPWCRTGGRRRPRRRGPCGCATARPGRRGRPSSVRRPGDRQAREHAGGRGGERSASSPAVAPWYSTSSAACSCTAIRAAGRRPAGRSGPPAARWRPSARSSPAPVADQGGQRAGGRGQVVEHQQRGAGVAQQRHRARTIAATNASVPSLPTTRWARTSTGRVWSRNELSP